MKISENLFAGFIMLGLLLFLSFPQNSANAKDIKWVEWEEGLQEAVNEEKILLVHIYADWCGWCKRMDANTFTDTDVIDKISNYFVPVKINPADDKKYQISEQELNGQQFVSLITDNNFRGYPATTLIILNEQGTPRHTQFHSGYAEPKPFLELLEVVMDE